MTEHNNTPKDSGSAVPARERRNVSDFVPGQPYFEWLNGKTVGEFRGLHDTDSRVVELHIRFTDGTVLRLGASSDTHIFAVDAD